MGAPDDLRWLRLAEKYLTERCMTSGVRNLHAVGYSWWNYEGGRYVCLPPNVHKKRVYEWCQRFGGTSDPQHVYKVMESLRAICYLGEQAPLGRWLDGYDNPCNGRRDLICTKNKLIAVDGTWEGDTNPRWFSMMQANCLYDPKAEYPRWLEFLDRFVYSQDHRPLKQMFGKFLLPRNPTKTSVLMLQGPKDSGKSTIGATLIALLGMESCASRQINDFNRQWIGSELYGKALNVADESTTKWGTAESYFKQFTGGNPFPIERKGVPAFEDYPTANIVVMVNDWPQLKDSAVYSRLICIPMKSRLMPSERDETYFYRTLLPELSGILNWAMEGAREVRAARGQILDETTGAKKLRALEARNRPAEAFVEQMVVEKPGAFTPTRIVESVIQTWADTLGCDAPTYKQVVTVIRETIPTAVPGERGVDCDQTRCRGIRGVEVKI